MDEFHGLPGERIVEGNLSYCLGDLPLWLCTHHSPLSATGYRYCACLRGILAGQRRPLTEEVPIRRACAVGTIREVSRRDLCSP